MSCETSGVCIGAQSADISPYFHCGVSVGVWESREPMVTALLLMTLTADPSMAVVLVRKTAVKDAEALALTEKVASRIAVPGLVPYADSQKRIATLGLKDATTCNGAADCHAEVGKLLKVDWLVLVSVSQIATDQSLALELFTVTKAEVVERDSLLLEKRGDVQAVQLEGFGKKVRERIAGVKDVKTDAPVKPPEVAKNSVVDPKLTVKDNPIVAPPLPEKSHLPSFVLGGVGVAALGVGVGLLVSGLAQRAPLNGTLDADGFSRSQLSGSEATRLNDATSVQFGLAGGVGALGLGLLTTATALW